MKLESINFWFVLCVSVLHSVCQIMNLETHCLHCSPKIKVLSEFISWAMKNIFRFFRKNQIQKFFGPKILVLFGIKSVHGRPDSPSWHTNSWSCTVPPRVEPYCQLPSLLVHWSYQHRNTHAMLCKCGGVCQLKHGKSGLQIALTGGTDLYFK